jgi:hypothetical protein
MKSFLSFSFFLLMLPFSSLSQGMEKPSVVEISTLPQWAKAMYAENPNVFEVDQLYFSYFKQHSFVKSYHTQYYKRWRREVNNRIDEQGNVIHYTAEQLADIQSEYLSKQSLNKASDWSVVGPLFNTEGNGSEGSGQANIYSIDQCAASPNIMYAGTEPGEVYKSIDQGQNWIQVTKTIDFGSGVSAVEVHPTNPDYILAGGNLGLFRSTDGGVTWTNILPQTNFNVNEILINPGK